MVIDILGLLELVTLGAEAVEALSALIDAVSGEVEDDYADLSYEERKDILRKCTIIVVKLGLDVNCYPLGLVTTMLFDEDGNPLP